MLGIQEGMRRQHVLFRWCHGEANLSDGVTKETVKAQLERFYRDRCVWSRVHEQEMVSARKGRQRGKFPLDEEDMRPKRVLDRKWIETWPPDATGQSELNGDESVCERAFVNEHLPEVLETRQRFIFLESVRLRRAFAISWRIYRTSRYSVLSHVVGQALFL